jgi:hypothetical protein
LVTADYRRDLTVRIDAEVPASAGCGPATVNLALALTQTASDAVFDTMVSCGCE